MDKRSKITDTIKQGVLNNKEYTLKPIDCPIKINQNESPFDLPDKIKKKVLDNLKNKKWNIYPDFIPERIYEKVADKLGVTKENIIIGNGSNEMIFTLLAATIEKNRKIIISEPTFTVYKLIASNLNADIKVISLNDDFSYNVDSMMEEAKTKGSITIVCSPNNPTGTTCSYENIIKLLEASNGIVVVDEAYIHFGGKSVIELINKYSNLVILRTFSKAFGLAGLRIGLLISNHELVKQLFKVKMPYNLNVLTLTVLDAVFDDISFVEENVDYILDQRNKLNEELNKLKNLYVVPTETNFFLVKVEDSKRIFDKLLEYGVLVRDVSSYPMLKNYLRISIGSKEENEVLVDALRKIYKVV